MDARWFALLKIIPIELRTMWGGFSSSHCYFMSPHFHTNFHALTGTTKDENQGTCNKYIFLNFHTNVKIERNCRFFAEINLFLRFFDIEGDE